MGQTFRLRRQHHEGPDKSGQIASGRAAHGSPRTGRHRRNSHHRLVLRKEEQTAPPSSGGSGFRACIDSLRRHHRACRIWHDAGDTPAVCDDTRSHEPPRCDARTVRCILAGPGHRQGVNSVRHVFPDARARKPRTPQSNLRGDLPTIRRLDKATHCGVFRL